MKSSWFKLALGCTAILFTVISPAFAQQAPTAPRTPNIVLIVANDLGWGDLGCYGQTKFKTPNLDRLAAGGMRFTQCYAGSCEDAPSRGALLTGRHTGHAAIRGTAPAALRAGDVTVAQILQQAGYKTGAFGKWMLGPEGSPATPVRKGFDEFAGLLDPALALDDFPPFLGRNESRVMLHRNQNGQRGDFAPALFLTTSTNFIRIYHPAHYNRQTPFFLLFASTLPHADAEASRATPPPRGELSAAAKAKLAAISQLDADIGVLLDIIKAHRQETNTVVFFTSANGPPDTGAADAKLLASTGGRRGFRRDLYEGGLRVPLLVRWPGRVQAGAVSDEPCALWDFLPTACELAGTKPPVDFDGLSLLPTLLGQPQTSRHDFFYWENHSAAGAQQAARVGDWKALRPATGGPLELYNLKTDPAEKENVAAKNPEVITRVEAILKQAHTDDERWPLKR